MARDQLKLMESAIVLAEVLHFSRAARRRHTDWSGSFPRQVGRLRLTK